MKKPIIIIIIIIIIAAAVVLGIRFFSGDEDAWVCQNNQWVKHGNPSSPMPTSGCGDQKNTSSTTTSIDSEIVVTSPQPNQIVTNPITLAGQARGSWFFEASAPIKLVDDTGATLASSTIQATDDWMTANFVPFTGSLSFSVNATTSAALIFQNDNPSGLPQNAKEFKLPIILAPSQTIKVKVYFGNKRFEPNPINCNEVHAVEREIPKTSAPAKAALEELITGPTPAERSEDYFTSINPGTKIQKLVIENGVAKVDFNELLERGGGSCWVNFVRTQINKTLLQFSNIKTVIISINGRTEDILQP